MLTLSNGPAKFGSQIMGTMGAGLRKVFAQTPAELLAILN